MMYQEEFGVWGSCVDNLTEAQAILSGRRTEAVATVELSMGIDRQFPRCNSPSPVSTGRSRGLRRYKCENCDQTFNAEKKTPLSGSRRKKNERWNASCDGSTSEDPPT